MVKEIGYNWSKQEVLHKKENLLFFQNFTSTVEVSQYGTGNVDTFLLF